jgi:hypothetical protein
MATKKKTATKAPAKAPAKAKVERKRPTRRFLSAAELHRFWKWLENSWDDIENGQPRTQSDVAAQAEEALGFTVNPGHVGNAIKAIGKEWPFKGGPHGNYLKRDNGALRVACAEVLHLMTELGYEPSGEFVDACRTLDVDDMGSE